MKIDEMISRLRKLQETHDDIDVYLTVYECGEELKYKVENLFVDITSSDEYVLIIT